MDKALLHSRPQAPPLNNVGRPEHHWFSVFFPPQLIWGIQHFSIYSSGDSLKMSHRWFWYTTLQAMPSSLPSTPLSTPLLHSSLRFYTALKSVTLSTGKSQPHDLEGIWQCYFHMLKKKGRKLICISFCWNMQDSSKSLYTNDIKEGFITIHMANSTPYLELASNQGGG